MFLSREDKELNKQLKEEIGKSKEEIPPLIQKLNTILADYQDGVEQYTSSKTAKWEYAQVTTADEGFRDKIVEFGLQGWEMVGVTSYSVGVEFGGSGNYSVHFLYAFKS
jgi:hypothetical protein